VPYKGAAPVLAAAILSFHLFWVIDVKKSGFRKAPDKKKNSLSSFQSEALSLSLIAGGGKTTFGGSTYREFCWRQQARTVLKRLQECPCRNKALSVKKWGSSAFLACAY
jgi:hypothetical protein